MEILEKNFAVVVATDIDFFPLKSQGNTQNLICCDGASAIGAKFDLVVCNLPYLPSEKIQDRAVDGGPEGLVIPLGIIESASACLKPGAKMLLLTSSLANYEKMIEETKKRGLAVRILAKKKMFFEELIILEATKNQEL